MELINCYKAALMALILLFSPIVLRAQHKNDSITDWDRTFMPAIQMGYVGYGSNQLSAGLMIQTSIEYRHESNLVFRINYDDFNSNIKLAYPINPSLTYTGKVSFSEFIGGIGYRDRDGKHNFTGYIQAGMRSYGYPIFDITNQQANLDFDSRRVGVMRYSLGYEFALAPKLFLTIETLASHTLSLQDFWMKNRWSYGATVGISAPLF